MLRGLSISSDGLFLFCRVAIPDLEHCFCIGRLDSGIFLTRRSFADWIDVFSLVVSTCISIFSVG